MALGNYGREPFNTKDVEVWVTVEATHGPTNNKHTVTQRVYPETSPERLEWLRQFALRKLRETVEREG